MGIIAANIIAIYRRELQSYFSSPASYVIAGTFWLLAGLCLFFILLSPSSLISQVAARDQMGITTPPVDVAYEFLNVFLGAVGNIALFVLPMLSMGLYTEERKRGTLELLATSPITNWAVAVGKLLGVLTFFVAMILPLLIYEAIVLGASNPPIQPTTMLLGHGGLVLMAGAILSLGMFLSSITSSTGLAAMLTYALNFFLWVVDYIAQGVGGSLGDALSHLALLKNFTNFTQGIFDTSSIVLFLSYVVLGLFLTAQSIEAFRFQRS